MTQTFAGSAKKLAPLAAQTLGWRPHEFWQATPQELELSLSDPDAPEDAALLDRKQLDQLMERDRNG